jgi:hypothetical protein
VYQAPAFLGEAIEATMGQLSGSRVCGSGAALGLAGLLLAGCVCPPCAVAPESIPAGARQVLWDGEGTNAGAKGWSDCDQKPACKTSLMSLPGAGREGSTGLKFTAEGSGFAGLGWNLFGWWPPTAGIDISPYDTLTFAIKVEATAPELLPELGSLAVGLRCSKGPTNSANVRIEQASKEVLDGQWHVVEMPLADFYAGEGANFDPGTAWEFDVATWAAIPKNFAIYLDDIAVIKK